MLDIEAATPHAVFQRARHARSYHRQAFCSSLRLCLVCLVCVPPPACTRPRAKKLHEDRHAEMQQTLSQMNDRTEELERLEERKEAASKAKQAAEDKLEVGAAGCRAHPSL